MKINIHSFIHSFILADTGCGNMTSKRLAGWECLFTDVRHIFQADEVVEDVDVDNLCRSEQARWNLVNKIVSLEAKRFNCRPVSK